MTFYEMIERKWDDARTVGGTNQVWEVRGYGHYSSGMMIIAAKNAEDAITYANTESNYYPNTMEYTIAKKLWMIEKTEFEGVITTHEYVE